MYYIEVLKEYKKKFEDAKRPFVEAGEDVSKASLWQAIKFIKKYHFNMIEYFSYRLYEHKKEKPLSFVSFREVHSFNVFLNKGEIDQIFVNKERTYETFKKYYKRDLLKVTKDNKDLFLELGKKHNELIIKPGKGTCGRGIQIINTENIDKKYNELIEEYSGDFIAEELIKQSNEMSKFHPSSVNTLRIPTIRFDDEVLPHHILFRCGKGGSSVDNASAGGVLGIVDANTGMVINAGYLNGTVVNVHPDTLEKLVGIKIPRYEEAIKLVKELALVLPENRWVGWDLALTDEGWVMVEGNSTPQVEAYQILKNEGMYLELKSYFERLGKLDEFNSLVKRKV